MNTRHGTYKVYKHICPAGRIYIGIAKDINRRWNNGMGYITQPFGKVLIKYGWDNIKHEILYENLTKLEALLIEEDLIHYYKRVKNISYNILDNGYSFVARKGKIVSSKPFKGFKEAICKLEDELTNPLNNSSVIKDYCFNNYKWLEDAINKLGFAEIKRINNVTRIKDYMTIKESVDHFNPQIIKLLQKKLKTGDFISSANAKELFSKIYKDLNICKSPKGTDLSLYFEIRESMKRINDKSVKGFVIIRSKIL